MAHQARLRQRRTPAPMATPPKPHRTLTTARPPTPSRSVATSPPKPSPPAAATTTLGRSTRPRKAVVVSGAVPIQAVSSGPVLPKTPSRRIPPITSGPPPLATPVTPVSSTTVACITSLASATSQWTPQQTRDFLATSPNFPWSIRAPSLDSSLIPRAYFHAVSASLNWSFTNRTRLTPLARPTSFLDPEPAFATLSDVPPHLAKFYPKLPVPVDLMPAPRMKEIVNALADLEVRHVRLPGQFPWALRRLREAIHEKEHQWCIFVACRRLFLEQFSAQAPTSSPASPPQL